MFFSFCLTFSKIFQVYDEDEFSSQLRQPDGDNTHDDFFAATPLHNCCRSCRMLHAQLFFGTTPSSPDILPHTTPASSSCRRSHSGRTTSATSSTTTRSRVVYQSNGRPSESSCVSYDDDGDGDCNSNNRSLFIFDKNKITLHPFG